MADVPPGIQPSACYLSGVQKLLETIRAECSPQTWSRAVTQSRTAQITGKRGRDGSLEVRLATKGGMMAPQVSLMPGEGDWSCECSSEEAVCQHVAAAVIVLAQAEREGNDLLGVKQAASTLSYELSSVGEQLFLTRFVKSVDGSKNKLRARLVEERLRGADASIAASRADVEIDLLIGSLREGPIPRPFMPKLLRWLHDCDDVTLDGAEIKTGEAAHTLAVRVRAEGDGFWLQTAPHPDLRRLYENGAVLSRTQLCPILVPELSEADLAALKRGRSVAFNDVADLVGRILPTLRARIPVLVPQGLLPGAHPVAPRISLSAEVLNGVLEVLPTIVYGDPPCARIDAGKLTYLGGTVPLRDPDAEARLATTLERRLGLDVGRRKRLSGEAALRLAERVRELGNVHVAGAGLEAFSLRGALSPRLSADSDGFDLSFATAAGESATADAVMAAWQHGSPLVTLSDGGFAPLPSDFLAQHGQLVIDLLAARDEESGKLAPAAKVDFAALCEALDFPAPPELTQLRALTGDFTGIPAAPLPGGLRADLRSYQLEGFHWLKFLSDAGLGALLADDMGLGKTLQTLCALGTPALVVCPASVLFNWAAEIARFRPDLKVSTYHGQNRSLSDADVTLTTYAIMRMDVAELSTRRWDTVVLDEAQTIKNPDSQVARAAYQLPARFRVALTGTPVENRLTDLWSLFHFLHRGFLGGRADFEERYEKPIGSGDRSAGERLRARIKPFVLRRLKREVARELPPRTDLTLRVALDEQERALYDSVRAATQKELVEQLSAGGNVLMALEALLRLRQAACHRALVPGQKADGSSKLEVLLENLEETVSEGHKALVFSQWTSLLDLVEPHLREAGIRFTRLDGSTHDRGAVVRSFQDDPNVSVMLLSLKAGGMGLNLTAADHVFLLDPWWNPAAEDQAADRAHRIGQERPVFVHRLVAENTVEERILVLQEKKRMLSAVATDGAAQAASITREDLLALLA
jgi:superfamily II DNA or RNA helicase